LRTSGKRPLTSAEQLRCMNVEAMVIHTFADSHGSDGTLDSIFSLLAIFAVEIDTEFIVFSLSGSPHAHENCLYGSKRGEGLVTA
jgi:hypothetical protein